MGYVRQSRTTGSPGRIWLDTRADLARRASAWGATLRSAGVCAGDRVLLALPLASAVGSDAYLALLELGALTLAAERLTLADVPRFEPTVLLTTVSDGLALTRAAAAEGVDLIEAPLRLVVVTGEPGGSLAVTRRTLEQRLGATCLDVYATTELGVVGAGCQARGDGIHLDDTRLELSASQTLADAEVGELVVTTPGDWGTPLVSFHTGDLVRLRPGGCACGRGEVWAEGGVVGRLSEQLVVRGTPLLPSSIEQVVRRHPAVVDFRLRAYAVRGECEVDVLVETTDAIASEGDRARVAAEVSADLKRSLGVRLPCDVLPPGSAATDTDSARRARRLIHQ